jgi:para-nitrobenzyl esterase
LSSGKYHRHAALVLVLVFSIPAIAANIVKTDKGQVEGTTSTDAKIRIFKGIPYAAPPVGDLRWKAPQPAASWDGIRKAVDFGPRCMQNNIYGDMVFRDKGPSEDCLTLNVWTPAGSADAHLPVMVWIYGGGFVAGGTSEPRQDGENLSRKGVVVVSMNYRLGIFGFFALPELAKESGHDAAGNYGLLDQTAALQWVRDNIAAFGGDPNNVTIFGESAGSFSVSAQMASPVAKDLFHKAIGESGAFFGNSLRAKSLSDSEDADAKFVREKLGTDSLAALRAKSSEEI